MENLNESQRQALINKRKEMFAKMGISNAGTTITESTVATGAVNQSMAAKLAAIKNGAAKSEFNKFITATSKQGANGGSGFQIPEPKIKKNPNQQQVNPEYSQKIEDFGGPKSSGNPELDMIESMLGGGGAGSSVMPMGNVAQNPMNMELDIETINMPTFNPEVALQKKQAMAQQGNPYIKFASTTPPAQQTHQEFEPIQNNVAAQPQMNMQTLQAMMERIAKGIAEKTIKNVLNEYSEQQKTKNYFEYYNKEKGIIRTPDGKLYKLTQVQLKQK